VCKEGAALDRAYGRPAVLRYFQTRRSIAYPVTTRSSLQGGVKVDADDSYH
jgi:hypothetical protein